MMNQINILKDIYYSDAYINLYLLEDEELFSFSYQENDYIFVNKSIKRPIKLIGSEKVIGIFFDLESAYGYGGYYTNCDDKKFVSRALSAYKLRCEKENIIAEFIRFHPFNLFPVKYADFLDFNIYDRDVVVVPLSRDVLSSYVPKVRNTVRRAMEKVVVQKSINIAKFMELYDLTMKKNKADEFYFFNESYFNELIELEHVELYEVVVDDVIVAMGGFMFSHGMGHYHLSANSEISYKLNSNYALLHSMFLLAQKRGCDFFVLGGGATSSSSDPLLRFKKKFSDMTFPFYISGNVFNRDVYSRFNEIWEKQSANDVNYFLKYRLDVVL